MTEILSLDEIDGLACPRCSAWRSWRFVAKPARRVNSAVAAAVCGSCGERVFVKKITWPEKSVAIAIASRQFSAATELHQLMPSDPSTGPLRPLAQFEVVLAFEFIDGRVVSDIVHTEVESVRCATMTKVGAWFARCHQAGAEGQREADFAERYERLEKRCGAEARSSPAIAAALDYLRAESSDLAGRKCDIVRVHGDAKPENFMLTGNQVIGLDVNWKFRTVGEMDLAQFLVQFEIVECNFFGRLDEHLRKKLELALLDGYRQFRQVDPRILAWMRIYFWLSFWMSARERGPVHHWRLNQLFKKRLENSLCDTYNEPMRLVLPA